MLYRLEENTKTKRTNMANPGTKNRTGRSFETREIPNCVGKQLWEGLSKNRK